MLQKRIKELVLATAKELDIPPKDAMMAYRRYWLWIKETIEDMPLEGTPKEEFNELRTSINVPNIGKFYTSYDRVQRINKSKEIINERAKNKIRKTTT